MASLKYLYGVSEANRYGSSIPPPATAAWPMSAPSSAYLYQPETLGNEFPVLTYFSDFLETLDEGSFFTTSLAAGITWASEELLPNSYFRAVALALNDHELPIGVQEGMLTALLQIITSDGVELATRQAWSVYLKNRVHTSYILPSSPRPDHVPIAQSDRTALKANILLFFLPVHAAPSPSSSQQPSRTLWHTTSLIVGLSLLDDLHSSVLDRSDSAKKTDVLPGIIATLFPTLVTIADGMLDTSPSQPASQEIPAMLHLRQHTITLLDVSYAKLSSLDALDFSQLPALQALKLDHNELRTLPDSLGELSHLIQLSCCDNKLVSFPSTIGLLQRLKTLDAHNNSLTELPVSLWNCASLININVTSNLLASWHDPPGDNLVAPAPSGITLEIPLSSSPSRAGHIPRKPFNATYAMSIHNAPG
ncbi:hypothetical protein EDD22DRAFT_959779 [Suillus occidentalis]|nr:hypothetical protein EDD22DRAFT_959779 [Suillus occidentalis]